MDDADILRVYHRGYIVAVLTIYPPPLLAFFGAAVGYMVIVGLEDPNATVAAYQNGKFATREGALADGKSWVDNKSGLQN